MTTAIISLGLTSKEERCSRVYDVKLTRQQYNNLVQLLPNALSFDNFVNVLRPCIMGFYKDLELEQAFTILNKDRSSSIHIDDLSAFLRILNPNATSDTLKNYIRRVNMDTNGYLTYDQFRSLILKGIGRDIICNNI